jgi:FtsH-binding integral membrane protein
VTRKPPPAIAYWLPPVVADLVCVLVFAAAGKTSHEASDSSWLVASIAWPFALAVVLVHVGLVLRGRPTKRLWPEGGVVLVVTYVLGMALRAISGRGVAVGFLVVAFLFLGSTLVGWRAILHLTRGRRA